TAVPPATDNGCFQAEANYPHLVAVGLGLTIDDQTCSGANTANVGYFVGATIPAAPAVPGLPALPTAPFLQVTATGQTTLQLQADALSPTTDVVTVGIGGNDLGFAEIIAACVRTVSGGAAFGLAGMGIFVADCEDYFDDAATYPGAHVGTWLANHVQPRIDAVFAEIAAQAPNAQVFIVGYPSILTDDAALAAACFTSPIPPATNTVPFSAPDIMFLHGLEAALDGALESAAASHGFHFISTAASTAGHALCDPDPWMKGLTLQFSSAGVCDPGFLPLGAAVPPF